jgi:glycosyltransferase involved in cell wall biosynthesis
MSGSIVKETSVVHVMGRLDVGGAERMLLALCRSMPADRFSQSVITLSGLPGRLSSDYERSGVTELPCAIKGNRPFAWRFAQSLKEAKTDVLISHVSLASGALLLIARFSGVPRRVAVFHSDGDSRRVTGVRRVYRWLMRRTLSFAATDIIGVTASTLAFSGIDDKRSMVIPNSVDLKAFQPLERIRARATLALPNEDVVLAHVGRASPEKNRRVLPSIIASYPEPSILALAGAENDTDLELAPGDPIRQRIADFGIMDDMPILFSAADVMVLPSLREGLPLVILEAISCGCPVVASDLPGIRSVAANLPDVSLVPVGASPADFAEAIQKAISNRRPSVDMRRSLIDASLDLETSVDRWVKVCDPNR